MNRNTHIIADNGFQHVKFHVAGNFEMYSEEDIENIRITVVAMLCCEDGDVVIDKLGPDKSFIVVLAIKEIFVSKILHMDQQHIKKLCDLKVDYFILNDNKYYTESLLKGKN